MLKVVHEENETHEKSAVCGGSLLDEIVRDGARQLLAVALQAEVAAYIEAHAHDVDEYVVRHEALLFRMEVRDLHRLAVAAAG